MLKPDPELADRLESMKEVLGLRVIEEMYASNPFWQERFGARGRRHADQDAGYHLSYLASALRIGSPSVMTEYARWLRGVLVSRGMCSRHLAENFMKMREAIVAAEVERPEQALELLQAAEDALHYEDGLAHRIEQAAPALAERVASELHASLLDAAAARDERGRARCEDDVRYQLAYLADAVAADRPELFAQYATFVAGVHERHDLPKRHLEETLAVMERELEHATGPLAARDGARVAAHFAEARARLAAAANARAS